MVAPYPGHESITFILFRYLRVAVLVPFAKSDSDSGDSYLVSNLVNQFDCKEMLVRPTRAFGMRVIGLNCVNFVSLESGYSLDPEAVACCGQSRIGPCAGIALTYASAMRIVAQSTSASTGERETGDRIGFALG